MSIFTRYVGNGGGGLGTVTSVDMTVPSFLSVTGNPITTAGTFMIALSGTALPITSGGTGQITANAAINALLPSQSGVPGGYVLSTNGTNTSWAAAAPAGITGPGTTVVNNLVSWNATNGSTVNDTGLNLAITTARSAIFSPTPALSLTGTDNIWFSSSNAPVITSGMYNAVFGCSGAGMNVAAQLTTGSYNAIFGSGAGHAITSGNYNIAMGHWALGYTGVTNTGSYNVALGYYAATTLTSGAGNIAIGAEAGSNGTLAGNNNILIGTNRITSGNAITSGVSNIVIGDEPLTTGAITTGSFNILMGSSAGGSSTGSYNLTVGYQAAGALATSHYAVFGSPNGYFSDWWMGNGISGTVANGRSITFHGYDADGSTSNQSLSAFNTIFAAGRGTGTGNGSGIKWQYSAPTTSGTTAGTLTDSLVMDAVAGGITASVSLTTPTLKAVAYYSRETGTNDRSGTGTLSSGTLTISTTKVTSNSRVFVQSLGGGGVNIGTLYVGTITAGTSFVVTSTNALDTSKFNWWLIDSY
jgi:hypothetical protein